VLEAGFPQTSSPTFDRAPDEQGYEYAPGDRLRPSLTAGKAVFVAEYQLEGAAFGAQARAAGIMAMRKQLDLGAWAEPCWWPRRGRQYVQYRLPPPAAAAPVVPALTYCHW
jgi:hypothetical protein